MGWASYQEDNKDARGESKSSKSRKPEVPNRDKPPRASLHVTQKIKKPHSYKVECLESQFSLRISTNSTAYFLKLSRNPSRPKPFKKQSRNPSRPKPFKKQYVPVAKTRHVTSDEIQQRIDQANFLKTRRVATDDLQQRIQREIIRQQKESKSICPH